MARQFSFIIFAAMLGGVLAGWVLYERVSPDTTAVIINDLKLVTDIFLRLIKMIIGPLVFATLVSGIAHLGSASAVGRIGAVAIAWFIFASIISLTLGLVMVHVLQPGVGLNLPLPPADARADLATSSLTVKDFITHVFPTSFADAMARNEILQIVVFSIFIGVAIAALGQRAALLAQLASQLTEVMLKVTGYVMWTAPLAVFAAVAAVIAKNGLGILLVYGKFVGSFYIALAALWAILLLAAIALVGLRAFGLIRVLREPILLAFSTASSEAALPRTLESLRQFGVPRRISGFVLPLGYSFNLDGSMMYCTFAVIFITQVYGLELSVGQQITMLALLMLTSKGMAGVPRASLVVIAATLAFFNLPQAGMVLIFAVDQFLDMGRSATNVVGNAVASVAAARFENALTPSGPADDDDPGLAPSAHS